MNWTPIGPTIDRLPELPADVGPGFTFGVDVPADLGTLDNPAHEAMVEAGTKGLRGTRAHPIDLDWRRPELARSARREPRFLVAVHALPLNGTSVAGVLMPPGLGFVRVYARDVPQLAAMTLDTEVAEALAIATRTHEGRLAVMAEQRFAELDEETGARVVTPRSHRLARLTAGFSPSSILIEQRPDLARRANRAALRWFAVLESAPMPETVEQRAASEQHAIIAMIAEAIRKGQVESAALLAERFGKGSR